MICVLLMIIVVVLVGAAIYACEESKNSLNSVANSIFGMTIAGLIGLAICAVAMAASYTTNLGLHKRLASIEAYGQSISAYDSKAKSHFETRELTDLKYQNYQDRLGRMIESLRWQVVSYNQTLEGKKQMKKGKLFNWLIVLSPELMPLDMNDYLK